MIGDDNVSNDGEDPTNASQDGGDNRQHECLPPSTSFMMLLRLGVGDES